MAPKNWRFANFIKPFLHVQVFELVLLIFLIVYVVSVLTIDDFRGTGAGISSGGSSNATQNATSTGKPRSFNPYPNKPLLVFRPDGSFKLSVFSDLHFGENPWEAWGPKQDMQSLAVMNQMLTLEKPDFVAVNGDLITGENTFRENSTTLIDILVKPFADHNVPFACSHGNHDNQPNITHAEEIERLEAVAPTSYTRRSPPGVGGEGGEGNFWVPVYGTEQDSSPSLIMWFFDSRGGFSPGAQSAPLPDWVDESVGAWLEAELLKMDAAWGPADNRAAIAFVHIPLHAMQPLQATLDHTKQPGLDADILGQGTVQSSKDPTLFGTGKDEPFWKSLTMVPNLHAVVSGHVHGNEWCARDGATKRVLCFNKHTGYGGYSQPGWGHGIRSFIFSLGNLTGSVESYIMMENGAKSAAIIIDSSYGY